MTPEATSETPRTAVPATLQFRAETVDGRPFSGASLAGKPVVLWFWAPWCPTCRSQIPQVQDLAARYGDRVGVVGVGSLDDRSRDRGLRRRRPRADPARRRRRFRVAALRRDRADPSCCSMRRAPSSSRPGTAGRTTWPTRSRPSSAERRVDTSALLLSFSAGLVAAVNPCGFALLPAYLGLLVLGEDSPTRGTRPGPGPVDLRGDDPRVRRGLPALRPGDQSGGVLRPATPAVAHPRARAGPRDRRDSGCSRGAGSPASACASAAPRCAAVSCPVLLYGIGYAAASLTCTIAPFLAVVVFAFRSGSTGEGLLLFAVLRRRDGHRRHGGRCRGRARTRLDRGRAPAQRALGRACRRCPAPRRGRLCRLVRRVGDPGAAGRGARDRVVEAALGLQSGVAGLVGGVGLWWLLLLLPFAGFAVRRRVSAEAAPTQRLTVSLDRALGTLRVTHGAEPSEDDEPQHRSARCAHGRDRARREVRATPSSTTPSCCW